MASKKLEIERPVREHRLPIRPISVNGCARVPRNNCMDPENYNTVMHRFYYVTRSTFRSQEMWSC